MTEEERDVVLNQLHEDLDVSKNLLWTIKEQVQKSGISNYPIFVASDEVIDLGRIVIDKEQLKINRYFFASHLEEFAVKEIVAQDKVDAFREVYKEHKDELCIFVINKASGDFVFLPF